MSRSAAYFAGFFDGEGCVLVHLRKTSMQCMLVVVNTHRGILDELQAAYGGNVKTRGSEPSHRMQQYNWNICGEQAEVFARDILPHSIVKAPQLELFLQARELMRPTNGGRHAPLTLDELAARRDLVERTGALKRVAS